MVKRCTVPVLGMAVNPILLWVIHNAMNHPWLGIVFLMVYTCLIMFIPPIKIVIFLGDGLWHCFTDLTSHYIPFKQHFLWSTDHVFCPIPVLPCVAHLLAPAVGDLPDGVRQPRWWYRLGMDSWAIFFCKPPKRKKSKIQLWLMDNYPITNLYYGTINYQRIVDNYGSNCLTRSSVRMLSL